MATGSTSFTVFLCLLFLCTLSYARTPVDLPTIDEINRDSFSESDKNPTDANSLLLPSEKSESEPLTVIQSERETSNSKISKPDAGTLESTEYSAASEHDPITVISFRPINRHIPRRPLPLSFRLGHRCRHNHQFKPWNPRHQIPYGNDMILANVADRSFDVEPRGGVRQIPARWMRFGHVDSRFSHEPGMERSEVMRKTHHRHHSHDHDHDHEDGGLMKRIRKFLNHF